MNIKYFNDDIFFNLKRKRELTTVLKGIIGDKNKTIESLCVIFVSDEKILELNQKYLKHDYYTDVITFDNSVGERISGEIYVGVNTVKENASEYKAEFEDEIFRVIIHGVLHLCGYKDETEGQKKEMGEAEEKYLNLMQKTKNL